MRIQFILEIYVYRPKHNDKNKTTYHLALSTPYLIWQFCMEIIRFQCKYFQLKNGTPVFFKKVFVFQKICFKVNPVEAHDVVSYDVSTLKRRRVSTGKVLKTFKISTGCLIKTYRSLKRRAILKSRSTVF